MANAATILSTTSATPGPIWCEFTNAANIAINASGTNSGVTVATLGLPANGAAATFTANVPIAVCVLNQSNIQGSQNTGMPTGVGVANIVFTNSTTLTIDFVNAGAATNIAANTRFLLYMADGV